MTKRQLISIVRKAAQAALGRKLDGVDDGDFYSARAWRNRGEDYGRNADLIITHDGGDLAPLLNLDYEQYDLHNAMFRELCKLGYWTEQCTSWYTALYKS